MLQILNLLTPVEKCYFICQDLLKIDHFKVILVNELLILKRNLITFFKLLKLIHCLVAGS